MQKKNVSLFMQLETRKREKKSKHQTFHFKIPRSISYVLYGIKIRAYRSP